MTFLLSVKLILTVLNKNIPHLTVNQKRHLSKTFVGKNMAEVKSDGERSSNNLKRGMFDKVFFSKTFPFLNSI